MNTEMNKSEYDYKPFEIVWTESKEEKRLLIDGVSLESCIELGRKNTNGREYEIYLRNPYPRDRGKLIYTTARKKYDEV